MTSKPSAQEEALAAALGHCRAEHPLATDAPSLVAGFCTHLTQTLGRRLGQANDQHLFAALALALRARMLNHWQHSEAACQQPDCRRTHYLSLEYLMGRLLGNTVLNLGLEPAVEQALQALGLELENLEEAEADAGLGNGGLGRLAACFLDSCATLRLPVRGYGIRYAYGMFRQRIQNGHQVEEPDHWLLEGNPWEVERRELARRVRFGGRVELHQDEGGRSLHRWVDTHDVLAVPYDLPIPGYRNETVNILRLWSAAATDAFDYGEFNAGSYTESVRAKNEAENITMVLYPNDASESGKELRLRQQYFLVSATLQDVLAEWQASGGADFRQLARDNCFHLNDTHPALAVAELMRLLLDQHGLDWEGAWEVTRNSFAYTNHTLLPEALETWPVELFQQLLPRLLEIIYGINADLLSEVAERWPGDNDRLRRMSLIDEHPPRSIRMAWLAVVGSHSVNGVAALHTRLLQEGLFHDFSELWPERFVNVTNGVTPRRWLAACNPGLRGLIDEAVGGDWLRNLERIRALAPLAEDAEFRRRWRQVRQDNRRRLIRHVHEESGVLFSEDSMLDVQVKRFHEYKRQLLNALHVIHLYDRIKRGDTRGWTPRSVLFGGKAAPGYVQARTIIKLINNIAQVVNADPDTRALLRVAFLPNYRVSAMEYICPGTDLSEQISTAGMEASGTGNMKFMLNGALTLGTLDGANIEILQAVGEEHFFLFGLTARQAQQLRGHCNPDEIIATDPDLKRVMNLLESGHFNRFEPGIFDSLTAAIRDPQDPWLVAADFRSYLQAQQQAARRFQDPERWTRSSILNTAHSAFFSTDRTIAEYNQRIWQLTPLSGPAGS